MSECFQKLKSLGTNVKVELDLFNYATKAKWCSKNKVVKKTEYNELVKNANYINTIDTSDVVKKRKEKLKKNYWS